MKYTPTLYTSGFDPLASGITLFNSAAIPLFMRARQRARLLHVLGALVGKPRELLALDPAHWTASVPIDTRMPSQVPLPQIRGSVNRNRDFDCDFYPLNDTLRERWVRIASMLMEGANIPPVDLLVVGDSYFVIDGHHRISVCRMFGQRYIDAVPRFRL